MSDALAPRRETCILDDIADCDNPTEVLNSMRRFCNPEISRSDARTEIESITRCALSRFTGLFSAAPLLLPVARAGVAMWSAADAHFNQPVSAFVIARKKKGTTLVDVAFSSGIMACTAHEILMLDTVAATGDTIVSVAQELRQISPEARISALICYASPEAIAKMKSCEALERLGVAVRSKSVDPLGWLLPKIGGDAGDKLYGVPE